jgi:DNA polymerase III sliding clamp (beta) subunit (PCNA family)
MSLVQPFSMTVKEKAIFRAVCETLIPFTSDNTWLKVKDGLLTIEGMSDDHISMVVYVVPMEQFKPFQLPKDTIKFPISLNRIATILKQRPQKEFVLEWHPDTNETKLKFEKPKSTMRLTTPNIELVELPNPSTISLTTKLSVDPDYFAEAIRDSEIISDYMRLLIKDRAVEIAAFSNSYDYSNRVEFNEKVTTEKKVCAIKECKNESTESWYPIRPLISIMKKAPIFEQIELKYDNRMPMLLSLLIKKDLGGITFFLAPYDPSEDEEPLDDEKGTASDDDEEVNEMLEDLEGEEPSEEPNS